MNKFLSYIKEKFPAELKLIIQLTQSDSILDKNSGFLKKIDWDIFIRLVIKHRMVSHVLMYPELLPEIIPEEIVTKLKQFRLDQSRRSLNYTIYIIQIHKLFIENKISHCFFKGPLLSLELYHDIGYRNFGDIDILVEKENAENAKFIIEDLGFKCIYPSFKLTKRQKKANYSISHHYHFTHPNKAIDVELHWNISNPKSYFNIPTKSLLENSRALNISNFNLPYISKTENLVYLAAHGSIHQWYRLFWLKDFSVLVSNSDHSDLNNAWILSKKLKLSKSFWQACMLSSIVYHSKVPGFVKPSDGQDKLLYIPLKSIHVNELKQQGVAGKFKYIFYRLKLKQSWKYYFDLTFRLRTHLSDWESLKLPDALFFLYYFLRPFIWIYKSITK